MKRYRAAPSVISTDSAAHLTPCHSQGNGLEPFYHWIECYLSAAISQTAGRTASRLTGAAAFIAAASAHLVSIASCRAFRGWPFSSPAQTFERRVLLCS